MQKREAIQHTLQHLDKLVFTSSRLIENCAQELGMAPLGQKLSARELLRRPEVGYHQIAQLAQRVEALRETFSLFEGDTDYDDRETILSDALLPQLPEQTVAEIELQVKYESYVRKQEQSVHRTQRLEEMRIPDTLDYQEVQHLRTEARQKLTRTRPRTVGQASRVEGVTPADIAILMIYLEKQRLMRAHAG
jgi:tRNA uridine 5-carboxymethylaminomethyl modification enzyme